MIKKMLAKAIKDITDPQLKKILSHCIIQYYSASIKLGSIAVPTAAAAVMNRTNSLAVSDVTAAAAVMNGPELRVTPADPKKTDPPTQGNIEREAQCGGILQGGTGKGTERKRQRETGRGTERKKQERQRERVK